MNEIYIFRRKELGRILEIVRDKIWKETKINRKEIKRTYHVYSNSSVVKYWAFCFSRKLQALL